MLMDAEYRPTVIVSDKCFLKYEQEKSLTIYHGLIRE